MAIISPQLQALTTHRHTLAHTLGQLSRVGAWGYDYTPRAPVCYDNRYPTDYYRQRKNRSAKLLAKNNRSQADFIEIINQGLADDCQNGMHPELHELVFITAANKKPRPTDPQDIIGWLLAQAAGSLKLQTAPPTAQKYLNEALARFTATPAKGNWDIELARAHNYKYQAMLAEAQHDFGAAQRYLTQAITAAYRSARPQGADLKYLYLRRALTHGHTKQYGAALRDLAQALTYHRGPISTTPTHRIDKLIYWERVKIFLRLKDFVSAHKNLDCLINLTVLKRSPGTGPFTSPPRALAQIMTEFSATLPPPRSGARPLDIPGYCPRIAHPEAPANYLSYQVNAKCPRYQAFIAQIYRAPQKSLRDWEYLVVYEFTLLGDYERKYDNDISPTPPVILANPPRWWIPGLQAFYLDRDYRAADKFFTQELKKHPCLEGYELAAKTKLALGKYRAAVPLLSAALSLREKFRTENPNIFWNSDMPNTYLLLRGIAQAKTQNRPAALKDFTAAIDTYKPEIYDKLKDILHWERARVYMEQGELSSAIKDLQAIKQNKAVIKYLAELRRK